MKNMLLLLTLLFVFGCSPSYYDVKISWTEPTNGAPIESYVVAIDNNSNVKNIETQNNYVTTRFEYGVPYVAYVWAISVYGYVGPASEKSETFYIPKL